MSEMNDRVERAVEQFRKLNQEWRLLKYDEDHTQMLGVPCNEKQLAQVAKKVGCALPPSYVAFLRLHNGWTDFAAGGAMLLPAEEYDQDWFGKRMSDLRGHLREFFDEKTLDKAAIIMLGERDHEFAFFDKTTRRADGEMDLVNFSTLDGEIGRYPDFVTFLESKAKIVAEIVAEEKER